MSPHFDQDEDEILGKAYDGRLVRRLLPYVKPYWHRLLIAVLFLLGTSVLDLAPPFLTKIAIDRYITPGKPSGLMLILVLFMAALAVSFVLRYFMNYF